MVSFGGGSGFSPELMSRFFADSPATILAATLGLMIDGGVDSRAVEVPHEGLIDRVATQLGRAERTTRADPWILLVREVLELRSAHRTVLLDDRIEDLALPGRHRVRIETR